MSRVRLVPVVVLLGAGSMIALGVWGRLDPAGFADWAGWPHHEHFLHDAGVFQIAIGLMMAAALWWPDALAVGLAGFVFTNAFHAQTTTSTEPTVVATVTGSSCSCWPPWAVQRSSCTGGASGPLSQPGVHRVSRSTLRGGRGRLGLPRHGPPDQNLHLPGVALGTEPSLRRQGTFHHGVPDNRDESR